jgi:diguanylate cyclase (GGDEF)-like protein
MMDLNEFKQVNDIYGHNAGDKILIYIGGQIKNCLRISDFASRWGGDEFVLVLNAVDRKAIEQIAENLYEKITIPYYLSEHDIEVSVGVSMGATFYPNNEKSLVELIKLADKAMYKSKQQRQIDPEKYLLFSADLNL